MYNTTMPRTPPVHTTPQCLETTNTLKQALLPQTYTYNNTVLHNCTCMGHDIQNSIITDRVTLSQSDCANQVT